MPLVFITGPVRSGKSRFAERLARERGFPVTYVATGRVDPDDAEWVARIAHHAARRPVEWQVVETAVAGAPPLALVAHSAVAESTLLVDSLGTWLADVMARRFAASGEAAACDADALETELGIVVDALLATPAHAIVVGEECGWGIVPDYPSGRAFRDVLGRVQQQLAARAEWAYLVVAGHALDLKARATLV
jgi:adenosylcobinamide kinase/adenosylcobinamide-phosphate guanylyltransferase